MARAANSLGGLAGITQLTELRQRLFFLLGALVVFRIVTFIPVPGINPLALATLFDSAARHHTRYVQYVLRRRIGTFLGGGAWDHAVPSQRPSLCSS